MKKPLFDVPEVFTWEAEQELAEHALISEHLTLTELECIMSACARAEDVIPSQYYFALGKRDGVREVLTVLEEMVTAYPKDVVTIDEVRLGVPVLGFLS